MAKLQDKAPTQALGAQRLTLAPQGRRRSEEQATSSERRGSRDRLRLQANRRPPAADSDDHTLQTVLSHPIQALKDVIDDVKENFYSWFSFSMDWFRQASNDREEQEEKKKQEAAEAAFEELRAAQRRQLAKQSSERVAAA